MSSESHPISFIRGGERLPGTAELFEDDRMVRLVVSAPGVRSEAEASDYFEALQKVRREFSTRALDVFCYGSSRDIRPSGMGRSMGLGRKAYRLSMGKQATGPLLDIFDSGQGIDLVSADEQDRYFQDWIASLGR
jgi:hypothetical protein